MLGIWPNIFYVYSKYMFNKLKIYINSCLIYFNIIVLGPKYVTWLAMAIEMKGFFNSLICWTRWLFMWRIEITYPSLQKLFLLWLHMYFTIGTHGPLSWRTCFGHAWSKTCQYNCNLIWNFVLTSKRSIWRITSFFSKK
jgi:hypothetical protein